jgi:hypothetical protein
VILFVKFVIPHFISSQKPKFNGAASATACSLQGPLVPPRRAARLGSSEAREK